MIIVSQIIGGFFGVFLVWLSIPDLDKNTIGIATLCPPRQKYPGTCDPEGLVARVFIVEVITTFMFYTLILNIKFYNGSVDILNGMAVAGVLYGLINVSAGYSGACMNPGIGGIQSIFQYLIYQGIDTPQTKMMTLKSMWLYVCAPLTAGVLAGFWQIFNGHTLDKFEVKKTCDGAEQDVF